MPQVVIESYSLDTIRTTNKEINLPSPIRNAIEDINILTQTVKSIKFVDCSKLGNKLADMIAKEDHVCCI